MGCVGVAEAACVVVLVAELDLPIAERSTGRRDDNLIPNCDERVSVFPIVAEYFNVTFGSPVV